MGFNILDMSNRHGIKYYELLVEFFLNSTFIHVFTLILSFEAEIHLNNKVRLIY